jgi:hypothetical protein
MKMIGIAKKPEMRTVTQHTIFVPTADSCFSKGVQIFLYLSMAIRSRTKIDPRIVNVKAKLKVLQTSLQTNVYGNVRSKI